MAFLASPTFASSIFSSARFRLGSTCSQPSGMRSALFHMRAALSSSNSSRYTSPALLSGVAGRQARNIGAHSLVEGRVVARAAVVPIRQTDIAVILMDVDLTFHEHQVVRPDAQAGPRHCLHQAGQVASGVDDPAGSLGLEILEQSLQGFGHRRVLEFGEDCAIEIRGYELNGQ